jgi:hypothetical protein
MATTQVARVQITCINKPDRDSSHESISHLGNSQGKWTKEQVIAWIDSNEYRFYTEDRLGMVWIGVVREAGKQPYLRTHADGRWTDNLLALPECP